MIKDEYPGTIHNSTVCAQCLCIIDDNYSCPCNWDHYRRRKKIDLGQMHIETEEDELIIEEEYPDLDSMGRL